MGHGGRSQRSESDDREQIISDFGFVISKFDIRHSKFGRYALCSLCYATEEER